MNNKGNILRSNQLQVNQCICLFIHDRLENHCVFISMILTVNLYVDPVFSGNLCAT